VAEGVVAVVDATKQPRRAAGTRAEEILALRRAVSQTLAEVADLAGNATREAAEMLGFQVAMLTDDELVRPALEAVEAGESAAAAWEAAMDAEIAGYRDAGDDHFAARAADLEDIRDRVLGHLTPGAAGPVIPAGSVVVAADLPISRFLAIDWAQGGAIVLTQGSPSSHVAMLARARGVPMVVGLDFDAVAMAGREALVDAATGEVVLDPSETTRVAFAAKAQIEKTANTVRAAFLAGPAVTKDGTRIALNVNIASADELDEIDPAICDGIGLVRTELLFHAPGGLPDEEAQYQAYRRIVAWGEGRPVTIRTLDAGGDKPIEGVTIQGESNPFLGVRGVRLLLRNPGLFRTQLRALARASADGDLRIMLPMVTVPAEVQASRKLLTEALAGLAHDNIPTGWPKLGMMVEVPAAAIVIDQFDADFFSIGSNDLTQYVTAAGRDIGAVAELADPLNLAVIRLIAAVARHGREIGREVSLCGDAGGDPKAIGTLLRAGLRSLSVAPVSVGAAKQVIAAIDLREAAL
jgi:phosphoenolpyruvate-protein phosphotransferase (PTS system enzyme I)